MFIKYQHIERFGTTETEGIENGTCYVFPKIDGTNASIWFKDGVIQCGSRNRHLTLDKDNANFLKTMIEDPLLQIFFEHNPNLRLYGEWLVPHSLKTYKENAWRNFYIFDVMEGDKLTPYDVYKPLMDDFSLDYIPPIRIIKNGNYETFVKCLEENKYLIPFLFFCSHSPFSTIQLHFSNAYRFRTHLNKLIFGNKFNSLVK